MHLPVSIPSLTLFASMLERQVAADMLCLSVGSHLPSCSAANFTTPAVCVGSSMPFIIISPARSLRIRIILLNSCRGAMRLRCVVIRFSLVCCCY